MHEALVWERYGCPIDLFAERPNDEVEAHVAIVRGKNAAESEEADEMDREIEEARRKAS